MELQRAVHGVDGSPASRTRYARARAAYWEVEDAMLADVDSIIFPGESMDSIEWYPIHQKYLMRHQGGSYSWRDVDPSQHLDALFGTKVPGGFLLKLVTPSGAQITFVPGENKEFEELLRTHKPSAQRASVIERTEETAAKFALDAASIPLVD